MRARATWPALQSGTVGDLLDLPPRGYYLAHEAGWLAGVSGDRIGQWARRGYIQSSISDQIPRVYSYQDVAEAMVVHELVDVHHVRLHEIRRAVELLREEYGDWPLTRAPIVSAQAGDSKRKTAAALVLEHPDGGHTDLNRHPRHGVLALADVRRIAGDLRRGGWAVRDLPGLESIEVDPDRLSGRPAIRGTRVPAEFVAQLARTEQGRRTLKGDYGVTARQIKDASRWWQAVEVSTAAA